MPRAERKWLLRAAVAATALVLSAVVVAGCTAGQARASLSAPSPCQLPVAGNVCDAIGGVAKTVATSTADYVMQGVTAWVTNAAVWVTGKVGELIDATTSPNVRAAWFQGQYRSMVTVAGALALLMLLLAVLQSVVQQDAGLLTRAALGYLPMAFILAGVAIAVTGLLVALTDDMASGVVAGLGANQSSNLLQAVGDAYKNALSQTSGIPLFGVFLGAIILAIGAFVLWLELVIRDAAIYVCLFFLPLTFVAMIWPAASRWARRLVELLIAIVLAKFVIVAILSLASAAITNTNLVNGNGDTFERMLAGSALLVLAAWSPFALLRLLPMMEVAASAVVGQRAALGSATAAAGVQTPAGYMRQAMDRRSRASAPGEAGGEPPGGSSPPPASPATSSPRSSGVPRAERRPPEQTPLVNDPPAQPSRARPQSPPTDEEE